MKYLLLFLLGSVTSTYVSSFQCPEPSGIFPNPLYCHKFYLCHGGFSYERKCPENTFYDPVHESCNHLQDVECGTRAVGVSSSTPVIEPVVAESSTAQPSTASTTQPTTTSTTQSTTTSTTTTTAAPSVTPTQSTGGSGFKFRKLPEKVLGLYVLLADDDWKGFESNETGWTPKLYEWQQKAANVLFFTFVHPGNMDIPWKFRNLTATRGTGQPGAIPEETVIIYAIGGYAYSLDPNPWDWLTTKAKAEAMAERVAKWPEDYGCDGIDLDIEEGAGHHKEAGTNLVHFIKRLRELQPDMIISQPTYGFPQVHAENEVINHSWNASGHSQGLADSIGLMVYEGAQALQYVDNFAYGSTKWEGFPIKVNVPKNRIMLGAKGSASAADIKKLATESIKQDLMGIMVWYASLVNGLQYAISWDASIVQGSMDAFIAARQMFDEHMNKRTPAY